MRAEWKIKYNPQEPEEVKYIEKLQKFDSYAMLLWDLDQWLRNEIKYKDQEQYQPVRDKLYELLNEEGITLD